MELQELTRGIANELSLLGILSRKITNNQSLLDSMPNEKNSDTELVEYNALRSAIDRSHNLNQNNQEALFDEDNNEQDLEEVLQLSIQTAEEDFRKAKENEENETALAIRLANEMAEQDRKDIAEMEERELQYIIQRCNEIDEQDKKDIMEQEKLELELAIQLSNQSTAENESLDNEYEKNMQKAAQNSLMNIPFNNSNSVSNNQIQRPNLRVMNASFLKKLEQENSKH